ncbi:MAG: lectin [Proteobacteria bacterium]|nr:lectin [Pseudomonadota bacterium]
MSTRLVAVLILFSGLVAGAHAQQGSVSFFVTSAGPGNGADLGGLAGADKHCQALARAAGSKKTWHAYLSTSEGGGGKAVNARDRIGKGPRRNAKGAVIAKDLGDLHANPNINKQTALTEKGEPVNGRGDSPNMHDILTGTQADGKAFPAGDDKTCGNWTKSGDGSAVLGHHDRMGLRDDDASKSWNSSHGSRGCSQDALRGTGGNGLLYCFAAD